LNYLRGKRIDKLPPSAIVRAGISLVLEARPLFPYLTVYENLLMGAYTRADKKNSRRH
jgi:branched-chain amino acid transport system ATP-binding protein